MENKKSKIIVRVINLILLIIMLIILFHVINIYNRNNFNDFVRNVEKAGLTEFARDDEIKYTNTISYKIYSKDYNDAMFSKSIKVDKNTPYRLTCKVKTKNVVSEIDKKGIGAQISIAGSTERSVAIQGTTDEWKEIALIFNSKNREEVEIGFRLGGNDGNAKGEAWFTDFKLESGIADNSTEWKFACFIFESINVNVENKNVNLSITNSDKRDINQTIIRFQDACRELTNNKMTAKCDIYEIPEPITSLSYDEQFGYYVGPEDVESQIKDIINSNDYDHIFVVVRLGDEKHNSDIEVNDWIGLGYMDYYGIGFSNIRLPNSSTSYTYKYDVRINTFPEEVFLHEFLHSLERTLNEYNYNIPALHDYGKYGYKTENLEGLKKWYVDYMNCNIQALNQKVGLDSIVYTLKPAKSSNFKYSYIIKEFKEPENIIEYIRQLCKNITRNIKIIKGEG